MKGLVQRVLRGAVRVDSRLVGEIGRGLCVFVGVGHDDEAADAALLADRIINLRVFDGPSGKPDLSLKDTAGELLVVSQFTLMADTRRGRRPSYTGAARPEVARPLVDAVAERVRQAGIEVACGSFGDHMQIELHADGPITLMLDTKQSRGD